MDQVTQAKTELRLQSWSELITECQSSCMTVKAWCELHDVNVKSYYYWLRKIRKLSLENSPVPTGSLPTKPEEPVKFRKLEVQSPVSGMQAAVVIRLPQASVEVAAGTDQQTLEAVLLALRCIC